MLIRVNDQGYVYDSESPPVWLPPLNPKQLEIFSDAHRYLLVHGPRKCVEVGAYVWTPTGQARVEDLVAGDRVVGFDGKRPVASYVTGSGLSDRTDGYELKANAGHVFRCSKEHPIWCCYNDG